MIILDTVHVGPLRMRLIERPAPTEPELFAPRYYLDVKHEDGPDFGISYLDHDREIAELLFLGRVGREAGKIKVVS